MLRTKFEFNGVIVRAKALDVNQYSEPHMFKLWFEEEYNPDYNTYMEIEEIAIENLFEMKYNKEIEF